MRFRVAQVPGLCSSFFSSRVIISTDLIGFLVSGGGGCIGFFVCTGGWLGFSSRKNENKNKHQ